MSDKASFANFTCRLLYNKYNGDFKNQDFISELYKLRKYFKEYVRNIYEDVEEIPLFYYIDYHSCKDPDDIYDEDFEGMYIPEILEILATRCNKKYRVWYCILNQIVYNELSNKQL